MADARVTLGAGYIYTGRVIRVIDGDTLDVEVDLGFRLTYRTPLRLAHINAPEKNTRDGYAALVFVKEWAGELPLDVYVQTYKPYDKYGRYLATVQKPSEQYTLNDLLVQTGHAVPYEGGAR